LGSLACRVGEVKALLENATYGLSALKDILDDIEGSGFATGTDSLKILSDVLADIEGSGFDTSTDSLKALRDLLDLLAGSGFATGTDSLKVLSDVLDLIRTELTFQHQADATLSQANPEQNTWYTLLDTTLNALIYAISVRVATTDETIAVRITVDGQVYTGSTAQTKDTWYYWYIRVRDGTMEASSLTVGVAYIGPLEGRSVKIEVRKTTAAGTGTITGRVIYAKR